MAVHGASLSFYPLVGVKGEKVTRKATVSAMRGPVMGDNYAGEGGLACLLRLKFPMKSGHEFIVV